MSFAVQIVSVTVKIFDNFKTVISTNGECNHVIKTKYGTNVILKF